MSKSKTLDAEDWIKAAARTLTVNGPNEIKVERLARELNVTKGSFYWHFKNLNSLKLAMLTRWETITTEDIINGAVNSDETLETVLFNIAILGLVNPPEAYGGARTESAIREWAKYNQDVSNSIKRVDARRLSFLQRKFEDAGLSKEDAEQRSALFYATMIGAGWLSKTLTLKPETIRQFIRSLLS